MAKVYAMIANGTEETECLTVVDLLKRAGNQVIIVSVEKDKEILSSHGIRITADQTIQKTDFKDADSIFLPGGMPGSERLSDSQKLTNALIQLDSQNKVIAAICAAPAVVLGRHGLLAGKRCTCFPGFEKELEDAYLVSERVVTDGNIVTSKGLGTAIDLGLELIRIFQGQAISDKIASQIQYR